MNKYKQFGIVVEEIIMDGENVDEISKRIIERIKKHKFNILYPSPYSDYVIGFYRIKKEGQVWEDDGYLVSVIFERIIQYLIEIQKSY